MAVTESDLDPKPEKCPKRFINCAKNKSSMRSRCQNATDSKKTLFSTWLYKAKFWIWLSKEMSHKFVRGHAGAV